MGYSVILCADGESALRLLRKENYDLIMLDMIMPSGLDGLDTYKEILKIQVEARTVIISGYADTDRVKKALQLGVRQVLRKPYTLNELSELLKSEFQDAM
ncbi:MAG: response regulator [bacterium]|nr:response regulator [Gammaproteobacteria bacterium]HIL97767.1 response regulator [Pseudomonadales bacterium]